MLPFSLEEGNTKDLKIWVAAQTINATHCELDCNSKGVCLPPSPLKIMPTLDYENLKLTLSVLEDLTHDLKRKYKPPAVPNDKVTSAHGWSVRLETIDSKISGLSRPDLLQVCSRLAGVLSILDNYIIKWEGVLESEDPLAIEYKYMPSDYDAMDSIRIIADRTNVALSLVAASLFPTKKQGWFNSLRRD